MKKMYGLCVSFMHTSHACNIKEIMQGTKQTAREARDLCGRLRLYNYHFSNDKFFGK
jgi:hypothetical protein